MSSSFEEFRFRCALVIRGILVVIGLFAPLLFLVIGSGLLLCGTKVLLLVFTFLSISSLLFLGRLLDDAGTCEGDCVDVSLLVCRDWILLDVV